MKATKLFWTIIFFCIICFSNAVEDWKPSAALIAAIGKVESGGNFLAHNKKEDARGWLQIREICIKDVNLIYDASFTKDDCWSMQRSVVIAVNYLRFYGYRYWTITKKAPTDEIFARIWNGGPDGWKKKSTEMYWRKVQKAMLSEKRIYFYEKNH